MLSGTPPLRQNDAAVESRAGYLAERAETATRRGRSARIAVAVSDLQNPIAKPLAGSAVANHLPSDGRKVMKGGRITGRVLSHS